MTLFDNFKKTMPTNEKLCIAAAEEYLASTNSEFIKKNFSRLIDELGLQVYKKYLEAQSEIGQQVITERIKTGTDNLFEELDQFYMSVFQSRKSRAGGAFEYIICELFTRLGYPFSQQVNVEGAKPDFVLPSKESLEKDPLGCIIFTAKRTLRERWRQVVTEANKSYGFFLATIDPGISENQIKQMEKHKVYIVVPVSLYEDKATYQSAGNVVTFENFFKHYLDPAMVRWGLEVSEPPSEYGPGQERLI